MRKVTATPQVGAVVGDKSGIIGPKSPRGPMEVAAISLRNACAIRMHIDICIANSSMVYSVGNLPHAANKGVYLGTTLRLAEWTEL